MRGLGNFGALLGRFLIALVFFFSGTEKLLDPAAMAKMMADHQVPSQYALQLLYASAGIELLCGLAILLGLLARPAALLLFLFMIPVTAMFHLMTGQMIEVLKNLAIMGGLLMIATQGAGGWTFGKRRAQAPTPQPT